MPCESELVFRIDHLLFALTSNEEKKTTKNLKKKYLKMQKNIMYNLNVDKKNRCDDKTKTKTNKRKCEWNYVSTRNITGQE